MENSEIARKFQEEVDKLEKEYFLIPEENVYDKFYNLGKRAGLLEAKEVLINGRF